MSPRWSDAAHFTLDLTFSLSECDTRATIRFRWNCLVGWALRRLVTCLIWFDEYFGRKPASFSWRLKEIKCGHQGGAIKPTNVARWWMSFGDSVTAKYIFCVDVLLVCSALDIGKPQSKCLSPLHNVSVPGNNKRTQLLIFNGLLFLLITITYMPHI